MIKFSVLQEYVLNGEKLGCKAKKFLKGTNAVNVCVKTPAYQLFEANNVRDNRAAGDVEFVGADIIAKLSAETSEDRAPAASCSSHCYAALACYLLKFHAVDANRFSVIM